MLYLVALSTLSSFVYIRAFIYLFKLVRFIIVVFWYENVI